MKATTWFRIVFVVLLLFAAGHTVGFLTFRPATAEGQAVWSAMNSVHFAAKHGTYSYGGFYVGFGLFVTAFMLFQAWLAWFLGRMAGHGMEEARTIAWALCALQIAGIGLSLRFFGLPQVLLSVVTAVCLGMGAMKMRSNETRGLEAMAAGGI